MFGHKAPVPCDNWLGLTQYNNSESISKNSWVQEQYELGFDPHWGLYTFQS